MTKAELLTHLETAAGGEILATNLVETVGLVNRYISNVFTIGADADGVAIAQKRNVPFYVYDEAGPAEAAYYSERSWANPEDRNPTGGILDAIAGIYRNTNLRNRVIGVVCKGIRTNPTGAVAAAWATHDAGVLNLFMAWVASNGTIQTNGGTASDSDLEYVLLTEAWDNVETTLV